jgi:hypothetical protein
MDSSRFDCLAKSLAATTGRRAAAKLVAGSALGAIGLAHLGIQPAAAACKHKGERCNNDNDCCHDCCKHHKCRPRRRCRND